MQAPKEHHVVVEPAKDEDHVQNTQPAGKMKGALRKVKHKARKLKDKMKKATHTGSAAHAINDDKNYIEDERQREQGGLHSSTLRQHKDKDAHESSSDEYDTDDNNNNGTQLKYERLCSIGPSEKGSDDIEVHDGLPNAPTVGGAYWKIVNDSSPISDHDNAGLRPTIESHNYEATTNDDLQASEGSLDRVPKTKSPSDQSLEMGEFEPGRGTRDQIGVFSEDLSADGKLGIGCDNKHIAEDSEHSKSAGGVDRTLENESPTANPLKDGASEQMYRPVYEADNFPTAQTSLSINAALYGDVVATEDKLHVKDRGAQTGDDYPSNQSEDEFSFDKDKSMKNQAQTLKKSEREKEIDRAEQKKNEDNNDDGGMSNYTERWGKWSAEKLNNAVDDLALKLGDVDAVEKDVLQKTKSDVDYFDPNNLDDKMFAEQLASGMSDDANQEDAFLDGALAGSAVVMEKLQVVKDTVTSTLGYGRASPSEAPQRGGDEHLYIGQSRSSNGGDEDDKQINEEQLGFLQVTKSDVDYFNPNNMDDKMFAEQFTSGMSDDANQEDAFLDGALAGSAVVMEKLQEVKDTVASTLGYGRASPSEAPQRGGDEHLDIGQSRSSNGGDEDDKHINEEQSGFLQGIKEAVVSSFGLDSASVGEKEDAPGQLSQIDSSVEGGKRTEGANLSHEWSLDSASDVPQAAFL
ncbi:hypothetical protein GOP47_0025587 [Adiantum capillus-veneris]|uniref:Uncharacterized protein n=1 Tax=Adiantum capillus-veneris TaxID=13818 RepID=A0A9D4U1J9_ADICA|nr:hypothetical protein GOP47_0025587 [Adiantum capillus-veneris]